MTKENNMTTGRSGYHRKRDEFFLITWIISALLHRLNIPNDEIDAFTDLIQRRNFDMMFDSFEAYDVQEARRNWLAEGKMQSIFDLLEDKGNIPEEVRNKISAESSMEQLTYWLKLASNSTSMDEFILKFEKKTF